MDINNWMNRIWYENHIGSNLLLPFSWIYGICITLRRHLYFSGFFTTNSVPVPVIVVGNLTVGGTGKTPLVIWLCNYLVNKGYRPGVVSRGYGRQSKIKAQQVRADSDPHVVGDEPVLIAKRTGRPVAVSSDRYEAATQLLEHSDCNILICDDGLQHLAIARNIEIVVIDGDRRFGNGRLLPAGPLRESLNRLKSVDILVANGDPHKNEFMMEYEYGEITSLLDESRRVPLNYFRDNEVHLVTGIGNPCRMHAYLKNNNIRTIIHTFPDHHEYQHHDLDFSDDKSILMTEKDAVKCKRFAMDNMWYLPVSAKFNDVFYRRIEFLLRETVNG